VLDSRTVAVMKAHKSRQNAEKLVAGPAYEDQDLVFSNELGALVPPAWFTRATKRHAVAAKVPALSPHVAARHTWATLALEAGIHAKVVQERLGHSSISITLDRYSHVIDGMDREAAEKVAALFR
jgi:integrase